MEKQCFKCKKVKEVDKFYVHKQMKDGRLNKCIECTKHDTSIREKELFKNPMWHEKEKERQREKYFRLEYRDKHKPTKENRKKAMDRWCKKYPEKVRALSRSNKLKHEGFEKHHWNYSEGFEKNVIWFTTLEHNKLHRYMKYDKLLFMYRTLSGELLDTQIKTLNYWSIIKNI